MGFLMFTARLQALHNDQNYKEARLMTLTQKISDLQRYAANIADGGISATEISDIPGSLFGRQIAFLNSSTQQSIWTTNQRYATTPMMEMMVHQQTAQAVQSGIIKAEYQQWFAQQYRNSMLDNMYKEERQRLAKEEGRRLNDQEKLFTQEKITIETQLKQIAQEIESVKSGQDAALKRLAPNYVAGQG